MASCNTAHSRVSIGKSGSGAKSGCPVGETIERALLLEFVTEARNLVLVGSNSLGKTMIAGNIRHAAAIAGYSVLFRSAPSLLEELQRLSPEGHALPPTWACRALMKSAISLSTTRPLTYSTNHQPAPRT